MISIPTVFAYLIMALVIACLSGYGKKVIYWRDNNLRTLKNFFIWLAYILIVSLFWPYYLALAIVRSSWRRKLIAVFVYFCFLGFFTSELSGKISLPYAPTFFLLFVITLAWIGVIHLINRFYIWFKYDLYCFISDES